MQGSHSSFEEQSEFERQPALVELWLHVLLEQRPETQLVLLEHVPLFGW
jgi:hypothetical protein